MYIGRRENGSVIVRQERMVKIVAKKQVCYALVSMIKYIGLTEEKLPPGYLLIVADYDRGVENVSLQVTSGFCISKEAYA